MIGRILAFVALAIPNVVMGSYLVYWGFGRMARAEGTGEGLLLAFAGLIGVALLIAALPALRWAVIVSRLERRSRRIRLLIASVILLTTSGPVALVWYDIARYNR